MQIIKKGVWRYFRAYSKIMGYEHKKVYVKYFNNVCEVGPPILKEFFNHITTIDGVSYKTASLYYRDLILFFRYMLKERGTIIDFSEIYERNDYDKVVELLADSIDEQLVRTTTTDEILNFMYYMHLRKNVSAATRNRRLCAIRKFFGYADSVLGILYKNPCKNIKRARLGKNLPKYLTLEEAITLLQSIPHGENYERDYCIIVFFLNLGIRLEELCNINISDISEETIRIYGKGSKERILFLNEACQKALASYLSVRSSKYKIFTEYKDALFVSMAGYRISESRVYRMVKTLMGLAGLGDREFSPHKLRHTAATLMYKNGEDIRSIQEVLGHKGIGTTQIYTHVSSEDIKNTIENNPLSKITANLPTPKDNSKEE